MLTLTDIKKGFGSPEDHAYRQVLNGISLNLNKGEAVAITGPSGCGKTTLLNIIGSLDKADSGTVNFKNKDIQLYSRAEAEEFRNTEIGFIFQKHHLLPQCSLIENVLLPAMPNNDRDAQTRAETLIKEMGLWERRYDLPSTLSGGESQRAAVVRALINQPSLLLADEPTGALDEENAHKLIDTLLSINQKQKTAILMITHSMELAKRMDKVYHLSMGKLKQIK
jgi:lipoprotein-releasing system ATP-binding protein